MIPAIDIPKGKRSVQVRAETSGRRWRAGLLACELLMLAWVACQGILEAIAIPAKVAAPFQFDYEEGNILNALSRITHGLSPYPDPHAFPNVLNPYGPLAYYLLAIPVRLLGLSFAHARVLIVVSVLVTAVLLGLLLVKFGASRLTAAAFAFMYPSLAIVGEWTWLLRVDFLALAFSLAGFYVFCRTKPDRRESPVAGYRLPVGYWVSTALMVAAVCVKHIFLAVPAACVLYLAFQRRWREAAGITAVGVGLSGAALALLAGLTRGSIFTHLFLTHPDPFSWQLYLVRIWHVLKVNRPLVALAGVLVVSDVWQRRLSLPVLWLALATASTVTSGKLGSNWNHYLEWSAALCLCAGLGFVVLTRLKPPSLAVAAAAIAMVWAGSFALSRPSANAFESVAGCPQAYAFVRQEAGARVLAENVGAIVLAGKTVWVSNPFVLAQLVAHAGWSDKPLEDMVQQQRFDAILLDSDYPSSAHYLEQGSDRFSPQVLRAMSRNYRLSAQFECEDAALVYVPRK